MADSKVDVAGWMGEAWALYKANFALLCVATLVAMLLAMLTCGVLGGPLWAGLVLMILRVSRKSEPAPQIGDVFKGFDFFLQALLLAVVLGVAYAVLGFLPLVGGVAGLLVAPLVLFAMPLLVDRHMEFWPAIQASYEKAKSEYVGLLILTLLSALISAAGALLCGVGVILTAPFSAIVMVVAYRHIFEDSSAEAVPVIEATVVEPVPEAPMA
ncbi:MAG: hypothetical protein GX548_13155 [Lentisphaerae bacterium]|nr:hypothetical protein [Lentisphaerota bacterium]